MQVVTLRNPKLVHTLNTFSDWVFSHEESVLEELKHGNIGTTSEWACSEEYLRKAQSQYIEEYGFPEKSVGIDLNHENDLKDSKEITAQLDKDMVSILGVGFNALKMYYPTTGYIGWHHNGNCPGQNLLLTYSPPGAAGYFEYQEPGTDKIIRIDDPEGWSAKAGYYGGFREPDKIFWHCARSVNKPRMTISYVIRDQWMWDEMVQDIESDQ